MTDVKPFNCMEKRAPACLKMFSTKSVSKSYIFDIYILTGFGIK